MSFSSRYLGSASPSLEGRDRDPDRGVERLQAVELDLHQLGTTVLEPVQCVVHHRLGLGIEILEEVAAIDAQAHPGQLARAKARLVAGDHRVEQCHIGDRARHRAGGVAGEGDGDDVGHGDERALRG